GGSVRPCIHVPGYELIRQTSAKEESANNNKRANPPVPVPTTIAQHWNHQDECCDQCRAHPKAPAPPAAVHSCVHGSLTRFVSFALQSTLRCMAVKPATAHSDTGGVDIPAAPDPSRSKRAGPPLHAWQARQHDVSAARPRAI